MGSFKRLNNQNKIYSRDRDDEKDEEIKETSARKTGGRFVFVGGGDEGTAPPRSWRTESETDYLDEAINQFLASGKSSVELEAEADALRTQRDEAKGNWLASLGSSLNNVFAGINSGGLVNTGRPGEDTHVNVADDYDTFRDYEGRYNSVVGQYATAKAQEELEAIQGDAEAKESLDYTATIQEDMDRISDVIAAPGYSMHNEDNAALRKEMEEKYGLSPAVGNDATDLDALLNELYVLRENAGASITESGYDYGRVDNYLQMQKDAEKYAQESEERRAYAQDKPFWASVESVLRAPMQGVDFVSQLIGNIGHNDADDLDSYRPMNPYRMDSTNFVSDIRQQVSKDIEENTDWELFGTNVASFLYNTGMSMADSTLNIATFGPASIYFMGMNAAANQTKNVLQRGGTNSQALWSGLAAGAAEAIFEKFSVDRLLSIKNIKDAKALVKAVATQAGVEGSEEMFTEIANILTDAAIMGTNSDFANAVKAYVESGMSEEEANLQALLDCIGQIGQAAAGGIISGGFMGGGASVAAYEAGKANVPRDRVELVTEEQEAAYNAGRQEFIKNATPEELAIENEAKAAYTDSELNDMRAEYEQRLEAARTNPNVTESELQQLTQMNETLQEAEKNAQKSGGIVNARTERRDAGSRGDQRWTSGLAAEESSGSVPGRTGSAEAWRETQGRRAESRAAAVAAEGIEEVSTGSQEGIDGGTSNKTMRIMTDAMVDNDVELAELKSDAAAKGAEIIFFTGELEMQDDMGVFTARGAISADGKRIWVRADHSHLTATQIYRHEDFHAKKKKNQNLVKETKARIIANRSEAELQKLVDAYVDAYGWTNLSEEDVLEEIFADAYAGINVFEGYSDDPSATQFTEQTNAAVSESNGEANETRGSPGTKLSRDPEERRRALRKGEMVNKFKGKVNWPAYYEKIISAEYNPDYYDDGDIAVMHLGGQILTLEMQSNGEFAVIDIQEATYEINANGNKRNAGRHAGEEVARERAGNDDRGNRAGEGRESRSGEGVEHHQNRADAERGSESGAANSSVTSKTSRELRQSEVVGVYMDADTESAYPTRFSRETWNKSYYMQNREKAAKDMADKLGISQKKAKAYIDAINSIAKAIADDQVRLDYESADGLSSFVSNAEYGGSIDFSTICKKRRLMTGTFEAIQRALPNTALTAEEILEIRSMMKEKGYEVACGLCYVEGSRAKMGQYTQQFLEEYAKTNPEYLPNMAEMNTATGQEQIRKEHPEVYAAYEKFMNKLAQRKPKLFQMRTEYKGEILNAFTKDGTVAEKNKNGGLRMQSFSDFEIVHLIDCMQVITDMAQVGLAGQAYTKVPDFAWALGDTGLKINLSLIAKGVDTNGKLILDEVEGMPRKDAEALRNRYSDTVGTIIVTFNDEQLLAAMADPFIDFIIPFHRSQWKKSQYAAMGLPANPKDYTLQQNESYIEPVYNKNGKKQRPKNYMPNEYWDFSKTGKQNAEAYLQMCAQNNRRPKFYRLLKKNADGSYSLQPDGSTDGYWKTLIDFKMYNNKGKGVPQQPVRPNFNMDEANRMLREYKGGHESFPVAQDVADEFVAKYKKAHKGAKFSRELDSKGRKLSEGQQEYFKDSKVRDAGGKLQAVYHGTKHAGFTRFEVTDDYGYFFADSLSIAGTYSGGGDTFAPSKIDTWEQAVELAEQLELVLEKEEDGLWYLDGYTQFEESELQDAVDEMLQGYEGRAQYEVYLNLTDPLIIDGHGSNWDAVIDWYDGMVTWDELTEEQKESFIDEYGDGVEYLGNHYAGYQIPVYHPDDMQVANPMSTREWVREALESGAGYDGVIFRNIVDEGEYGRGYGNEADVFVAFNSNQIKSVNNLNPTKHDDIRFSRELDKRYMAAVRNKDSRTQERMVREEARSNFYDTPLLYHGTDNFGYTKFDPRKGAGAIFATPSLKAARTYAGKNPKMNLPRWNWGKANKHGIYELYGKTLGKKLVIDAEGHKWSDLRAPELGIRGVATTRTIADAAREQGYKCVIIKNCRHSRDPKAFDDPTDIYIFFEPERLKSAANITYDNLGRVIPVSKRFNSSKADVRESRELGSTNLSEEERQELSEIQGGVREVLDQMGEEYGWIKPGERPAREARVPKKTSENMKVSQTVRTILEAGATPDALVPNIEELVAKGAMSYEVYSDEQAKNEARAHIEDLGWDEAQRKWFNDVKSGKVSKQTTTIGWMLYNNAANEGNTKLALDILNEMILHQRNAAQAVQATRILKQLSPETQLYGVKKSVDRMQQELNERYKNRRGKVELKINEELAEKFMNAKTQKERDEALKDIYRDIGRQMPSSFMDKWNAWRYLAMLGNVRTHVRNVAGNAFFVPVVAAKNLTATAIESAVYRLSGKKMTRSKAAVGVSKRDRAILKAAWEDFVNVQEQVSGTGKYNDFAQTNRYVEEGRVVFNSKVGRATVEKARRANSAALEAEDRWFSHPHYAYALAQFCKANNISEEQIRRGKGLDKARAYAIKEAQKATYRDANQFSDLIASAGRGGKNRNAVQKGFGVVVEGILPFRRTPANILVRGLEYSPLGILRGIKQAVFDVKNEKATAAEAIDSISAGLTGTGLVALGVWLAAEGLVRGAGGDDEDEKKFEELMGHQAYALELPDGTSITLDWMAPEALPFFIGVNLWELTKREDEAITLSSLLSAVSQISDPLLEMSCLQSLNDLFDAVGYASSEGLSGLPSALASAATSYLTQGIPTLLGQAERSGEAVRHTTYTEKDNFLTGDMQYAIGKASSRIPVWDYQQIPFIDAWGRTESSGSIGGRIANNFLNPAYVSHVEMSAMEEELLRLYEATGEAAVLPERAAKYFTVDGKRKDLTAEEYVAYATMKGQLSYSIISDLVASKSYQSMSDEEKVKAISEAYSMATQTAKASISDYGTESWVAKAEEAERKYNIPTETYVSLRAQTSSLTSLKDKKTGETIDNSKSLLIMQAVYNTPGLSQKQREALFEYLGVGKTVRHYNKALVNQKLAEMQRIAG